MSETTFSRATWKRSACDRCRALKLRCDRNKAGPSTEACLRCSKSQAHCITSSTRPTGRPSSSRNPGQMSPIETSALCTSGPSDDGSRINLMDMGTDLSLDTFLRQIGMENHDFSAHEHLADDLVTSQPAWQSFQQSYQFSTGQLESTEQQVSTPLDEAGLKLSEIHLELSKQLYTIKSMPWDVMAVLELKSSHEGDDQQEGASHLHPLADVAKTSAKFETLLASLRLPYDAEYGIISLLSSRSPSPRPRTTQLLTALTCYILVVSIYDVIFSRVLDWLIRNTKASPSSQSPIPIIYLGGLPIPPSQALPGSLLILLTEHQLQPIEELMGLPDHFRISSRSDETARIGETGLLENPFGQALLNALTKRGEDGETSHDDTMMATTSLKEKMRQIKAM
ncbi:hypothetical protein DL771_002502 [Monosporascus sp. 5C6A]|nr:hypothetical protein DL771_002502 [Monosporascus sp. 5C6A]